MSACIGCELHAFGQTLKQLCCIEVLELQTTAAGLQRKQRKHLLSKESAPVSIKAWDKGGAVSVGLRSSAPGMLCTQWDWRRCLLRAGVPPCLHDCLSLPAQVAWEGVERFAPVQSLKIVLKKLQ